LEVMEMLMGSSVATGGEVLRESVTDNVVVMFESKSVRGPSLD